MAIWYRTGTVEVTNGSIDVVGTNTSFKTSIYPGDLFSVDESVFYEVVHVEDDTNFTLQKVYAGTTAATADYVVVPLSPKRQLTAELADRVNILIERYRQALEGMSTGGWTLDDQGNYVVYGDDDKNIVPIHTNLGALGTLSKIWGKIFTKDITISGNANAPTQDFEDNSTLVATTEFVQTAIGSLGTGNVEGPEESEDNHVAIFDGETGKIIKDSSFKIGKSVPSNAKFTDTVFELATATPFVKGGIKIGNGLEIENEVLSIGFHAHNYASSSHAHGQITKDGKLGSISGRIVATTIGGTVTTLPAGTPGQFLRYDGIWDLPPGSNDAMVFKGTLGTGGTVTALPASDYVRGWTYKVITAGTYAGVDYALGDLIIALTSFNTEFKNSDWIPAHIADEMNLKADVTYVDAGLGLKADLTYAEYLMMEGDPA